MEVARGGVRRRTPSSGASMRLTTIAVVSVSLFGSSAARAGDSFDCSATQLVSVVPSSRTREWLGTVVSAPRDEFIKEVCLRLGVGNRSRRSRDLDVL